MAIEPADGGGGGSGVRVLLGQYGPHALDVRNPREVVLGAPTPFPCAGFVTTLVPGQGFGADLALREGYGYLASGAVGLQVVDLRRARELFVARGARSADVDPVERAYGAFQPWPGRAVAIVAAQTYEDEDVFSDSGEGSRACR
jgi:hypothetical protein